MFDIKQVVKLAVEKAGSSRELAKALKCNHASISGWVRGKPMMADSLLELVEYIGGKLNRAMPDWEPESSLHHVVSIGSVAAGTAKFSPVDHRGGNRRGHGGGAGGPTIQRMLGKPR